MVAKILCFLLMVGLACAATWQGKAPRKPAELAHKEGCYIKEINDVIPYRSEITPLGYCYRIECSHDMLYYASCGKLLTDDPHCHLTEPDLTLPYPDCCPKFKCDPDNNLI
ncbi:unnamed protein product [Parnassius mnemosyne]|uniref:Single domain-containing protein n=1 Tax=Parnassius mnemosyne TaxID=213953 RepID=A0AAV1KHN6_9NEOP